MIKLSLPTKDLSVFCKVWQWLCLRSRTGFSAQKGWSKNSHACCLCCSGKQLYSLDYCQWYRYLRLINISHYIRFHFSFWQGKAKDKDRVNYHKIHAITFHVGKEICQILPCSHMLTGSEFTDPFFGRSKIKAFKKCWKHQIPTNFYWVCCPINQIW